jgi:hypothetical protein
VVDAGRQGPLRSHAPDYLARRADGSAVVVDYRPLDRIKPRDAAKFEATRRACGQLGWEYRVAGAPDPIVVSNVRWLAGYRHPRHARREVAAALRAMFAEPVASMTGALSRVKAASLPGPGRSGCRAVGSSGEWFAFHALPGRLRR